MFAGKRVSVLSVNAVFKQIRNYGMSQIMNLKHELKINSSILPAHKKCPYSKLFWSVFSTFGLNAQRYSVSLRIQSECGKIRTRVTPNTDTFHAINLN